MSRPARTRVLDVLGDLTGPAAADLLYALADVLGAPDVRDPATLLRTIAGDLASDAPLDPAPRLLRVLSGGKGRRAAS